MRGSVRVLVGVAVLMVALAVVSLGSAADGDKKVVLTMGLTNDYDSFNPMVGVEVPDFEVWNLLYATLTDKAAADFATTPGLAESWTASNGGKTYTYKLREGLEWSDGQPLTAEDVAYTINRARKEAWLNYSPTVDHLTAKVIDDTTVEIASSVPDPKLPTMDVYILPKHVWDKFDEKAVTKPVPISTFGVGSGPFTLVSAKRGQSWSMNVNPSYWQGKAAIDEIVFRLFTNPDAMVAALKTGEIDAVFQVPSESYASLSGEKNIVTLEGEQGGFTEISVNGGRPEDMRVEGIGNGHPALSKLEVRQAIAHAIDRDVLIDRVYKGLARPATTMSPSANPEWIPEVPVDQQFTFDLDKARGLLDGVGIKDSDGDGIREYEGKNINLDYYILTDSQTAPGNAEFIRDWLKQIGLGTTLKVVASSKLTEIIGKGDYDLFQWGWTPYVDPDPMLSYFQCSQLSKDPDDPTNYYNDANWCDPAYDADYKLQNVELDHAKRVEIAQRMLKRFYDSASYNVLNYESDLQAYRTDRFEGWVRQPAETGPVMFSNTSPSYFLLKPVASSAGGGGLGGAAIGAIVVAAVAVLGALALMLRRRGSEDERE
ncbi:MAG: ABC transporter substrate-binding protein [Gaiellales bacterium]